MHAMDTPQELLSSHADFLRRSGADEETLESLIQQVKQAWQEGYTEVDLLTLYDLEVGDSPEG